MTNSIHIETVHERIGDSIISSSVHLATEEQVRAAREAYEGTNQCDHLLVRDTEGWPYDYRACAICGKGLGAI